MLTWLTLIFFNISSKKYKEILATLNPYPLHLRGWHHDALFLINVFVNKAFCPPTLHTIGLWVPSITTRDHSTFIAPYCAKASPSARLVTAARAVGSKTNVFNQLSILLECLILSNFILFTNYCLLHLFLSF